MELNNSQQKAVMKKEGPCMVLAGPGSGKTYTLTRRIIKLIESGVPANEILVITFTKAAAIEMKERFQRLSDDVYPVTFGTFHSLFWGILQKELGYKATDIVMGKQKEQLMYTAFTSIDNRCEDKMLLNLFSMELSTFYNSAKNIEEYEPKYIDKKDLIEFAKAYEALKNKYHVIDFDDMLLKTYRLFKSKPNVLYKWQIRFSYFLIDEMQDMNDVQFELITMLGQRTKNIFCVGDDDQSIYGFRGANPKVMNKFVKHFEGTETIVLDYNYRNPKNLVDCAHKLISKNTLRFQKNIKSTSPDGKISINCYDNEFIEAKEVIKTINELLQDNTSLNDIAILY